MCTRRIDECVRVSKNFQKSPIKFTTAKLPSTRIILRNEWNRFEKSQPFATLGFLKIKVKGLQASPDSF